MTYEQENCQRIYHLQLEDIIRRGKRLGVDVSTLEQAFLSSSQQKLSYSKLRQLVSHKKFMTTGTVYGQEVADFYERMVSKEKEKAVQYLLEGIVGTIKQNIEFFEGGSETPEDEIITPYLFNNQMICSGLQHFRKPLNIRLFIELSLEKIFSKENIVLLSPGMQQQVIAEYNKVLTLLNENVFSYANTRNGLEQLLKLIVSSGNPYMSNNMIAVIRVLNREEASIFDEYCDNNYENIDYHKIDFTIDLKNLEKRLEVIEKGTENAVKLEMLTSWMKYYLQLINGDTHYQKKHIPGNADI